jgi:hypothetical protein
MALAQVRLKGRNHFFVCASYASGESKRNGVFDMKISNLEGICVAECKAAGNCCCPDADPRDGLELLRQSMSRLAAE